MDNAWRQGDWMKQRDQLKILLPTLREKKRYVSFQVISEFPIQYSDFEAAVWNEMLDFYGESGVSKLSFHLVKNLYSDAGQIGVMRCNNRSVPDVIAALGLISRLGDIRITIKILRVSGTIKGLKL